MNKWLGRFSPQIYAILRIVAGFLFACHGAQKLFGALGGQQMPLGSLMGVAGIIELVGGILIAVGFLTSCAAFVASGEMAFAYFMQHFPKAPLPVNNNGDAAVLFCFLFLYMAAHGAGTWSIASALKKPQLS
jgi:putative oxidoreductase